MFDIFFSKKEGDLDGQQFKIRYLADKNNVLLDVRTSGEYQSGSIPTAKNIDVLSGDFKSQIAKLDKSKTYFLFCRSGSRSGKAVDMMKIEGFTAFNLKGGMGEFPKS